MSKPSLLLAAGCSWVVGKNVELPSIFAKLLQEQLGLDEFHSVARNGSNNTEQIDQLVNYITAHHTEYSQIFVIWGVTSLYRWEMYSASANQVIPCAIGRGTDTEEIKKEVKYYFSHFWDKDYELKKLTTQTNMLNGYLKSMNINHLFVNSFQSCQLNIDDQYFYHVAEPDNDIMSFLCRTNGIKISNSRVPFLNLVKPEEQFNSNSVKELQQAGWLDQDSAHPTIKAHKAIADELYKYIKENNHECI